MSTEQPQYTAWEVQMMQTLTTLTNKIDAMHARLDEVVSRQKDIDRRVSALERARIYGRGWVAGVGAVAAVIGAVAAEIARRFM